MEEWKKCRLGEICKIYGRIGFRGYTVEDLVEDADKGAISLSPTNLIGGVLDLSKPTYISWDKYYESPEIMIEEDDVVIVKTGSSVGRTAIIRNVLHPMTLNPQLVVLKDVVINKRYLGYLVKSRDFQGKLASIVVGSAIPTLSQKNLANLVIRVPSKETQERIACILSALDDKIELNNRINHNLEQQAQALYKSWFVDFEPFRGGKFVDSELGLIPEGWRVGCYNDIISSTVSGDWGKDREVGNYTHKVSCIRGCDFADVSSGIRGKTPERFILEKNFKNKRLIDKDIVVEISGGTPTVSTGRICLVSDNLLDKYSGNIVCTNFCRVIRPCSGYSSYVFYSWLDKYKSRVMFGYENGTSGIKNFQISDFMEKEPVIIPPQTVIAKFQTIVEFYQAVIQRNGNERMECETVRDTLLPKLMSGELKINDLTC